MKSMFCCSDCGNKKCQVLGKDKKTLQWCFEWVKRSVPLKVKTAPLKPFTDTSELEVKNG